MKTLIHFTNFVKLNENAEDVAAIHLDAANVPN